MIDSEINEGVLSIILMLKISSFIGMIYFYVDGVIGTVYTIYIQ